MHLDELWCQEKSYPNEWSVYNFVLLNSDLSVCITVEDLTILRGRPSSSLGKQSGLVLCMQAPKAGFLGRTACVVVLS